MAVRREDRATEGGDQAPADAKRLAAQGPEHSRGAMYLGGYAIECKVKAIAMERHGCDDLDALRKRLGLSSQQVYGHRLEALIQRLLPGGVFERLTTGVAADAFRGQVNRWTTEWRYDSSNAPAGQADRFLAAVDVVWNWLENNI
ncbi:MAG TPA: hypothetical protein PLU35_04090 [Phycisphaerales bacterium]|nr:hypothetical protein [Phycisphaerales bacterium]